MRSSSTPWRSSSTSISATIGWRIERAGGPMADEQDLFENAPPMAVERRLGLVSPSSGNVGRRALLSVMVGWAPLLFFALAESAVTHSDEITPVLREVGLHARYLVATPLLVLAEAFCAPRLNAIVRQFVASGVVRKSEVGRLDEAIASTRRLLDSTPAEIIVISLAYVFVGAAMISHPLDQLPAWAKGGVAPRYSLAGWWHLLVSVPLLSALIFGWLWRVALWARLLRLISQFDLRLIASHPDHCAGLGFLGQSLRAFAIVALALASIVAGRSARFILAGDELYFNAGVLVAIALLFVAPLFVFFPMLSNAWRRGAFEYGAVAGEVGSAFEQKWLKDHDDDRAILDQPDFSATTDLYSVAANVYSMRFLPLDLRDLIVLAAALLLPFAPVILLAFPLDVIWKRLMGLFF
jgi:hypothetical protein